MINNSQICVDDYLSEAKNICSKLKDKDKKKYLSKDIKSIKL
jgi:hypothetical protein